MNKKYVIDDVTLGILLGLEEKHDITQAYIAYIGSVTNATQVTITAYVENAPFSPERKEELKVKLKEKVFKEDVDPDTEEIDKELQFILSDPRLQEKIERMIVELNKVIYDAYHPKLTEEKRKELEEYLVSYEQALESSLKYMQEMIKIVKDEESNIQIANVDQNASPSSENNEAANIPYVIPADNKQVTQPQTASSDNSGPTIKLT